MSKDEGEAGRPGSSLVGYRRPPVEHRFKKGRSGNPSGRPKKKKAPRQALGSISIGDYVLHEAYRSITIRENDQPVTMPMIQAVVRSLGVAAVKGSHRAQATMTALVQAVERGVVEDKTALMAACEDYKTSWTEAFAECDRRGEPRPEPLPHPDDIVVDGRTGEIIFNGPFDERQKAQWDKFKQLKADSLDEIRMLRSEMKKRPRRLDFLEDDAAHAQWLVDLVDRHVPDEQTRRAPDFDLSEWRLRQHRVHEITGRTKRPKWRGLSAAKAKASEQK